VREADKIKAERSYTVSERWRGGTKKELYVKAESWTTDYNAAHQATPEAAIDYEITKAENAIEEQKQRILALVRLKENS
jgi:hypothetical protein